MSIECFYKNTNPFFISDIKQILWNRTLSSGNQNTRFTDFVVITEDHPLKPLHTVSFLRVKNRERKVLAVCDIGGASHTNPNQSSVDGLNINNQQGLASETYNYPPFALCPILPCIEQWKKVTYDAPGSGAVSDRMFSPIEHPASTRDDMRLIRAYYSAFRISASFSPTSKALSYGNVFINKNLHAFIVPSANSPSYSFLYMFPDMDFPEENELIISNNTFDTFASVPLSVGSVNWPTGFEISADLTSSERTTTNTPSVITSPIFPTNQKILRCPTANFSNEAFPGNSDVAAGYWNLLGLVKRYKGTPHYKRSNATRYRHDFNLLANWTGIVVSTTSSGVSNLTFDFAADYMQDVEYEVQSDNDYLNWETDQATSNFIPFQSNGTTPFVSGAKIRHRRDQSFGNSVPAKYNMRYNQGAVATGFGYFLWNDWVTGSDFLVDYYAETEDLSPLMNMRASLGNGTQEKFIINLGRIGARGNAYRFKFHKTSSSYSIDTIIGNVLNRQVYEGDMLKYEVLVDSISPDNKVYLDIEYYNSGVAGATSLLSTLVPADIWKSEYTLKKNNWYKVTIPFPSAMNGKFIKNIRFRAIGNNATLGICRFYISEVQIINLLDCFNGRQFISSTNLRRVELGNTTLPQDSFANQNWRPFIGIVGVMEDPVTGNTGFFNIYGNVINESTFPFDSVVSGLGTDSRYKWFNVQMTIPYSAFLKEIIYLVTVPKTYQYSSGKWSGPQAGGSLDIERTYLYPTGCLDFVLSYSTDATQITSNPLSQLDLDKPYNNPVDYDDVGFKAFALKLTSKYFDVDQLGG